MVERGVWVAEVAGSTPVTLIGGYVKMGGMEGVWGRRMGREVIHGRSDNYCVKKVGGF